LPQKNFPNLGKIIIDKPYLIKYNKGMKVGTLVKLKHDTTNYITEIQKSTVGLVIHSESVDHTECMDETCSFLVYVKWAGVDHGLLEGKYWIYHDIDLDIVQAA
jgi:hypothetical protein